MNWAILFSAFAQCLQNTFLCIKIYDQIRFRVHKEIKMHNEHCTSKPTTDNCGELTIKRREELKEKIKRYCKKSIITSGHAMAGSRLKNTSWSYISSQILYDLLIHSHLHPHPCPLVHAKVHPAGWYWLRCLQSSILHLRGFF
jgi:hypothetical protein